MLGHLVAGSFVPMDYRFTPFVSMRLSQGFVVPAIIRTSPTHGSPASVPHLRECFFWPDEISPLPDRLAISSAPLPDQVILSDFSRQLLTPQSSSVSLRGRFLVSSS